MVSFYDYCLQNEDIQPYIPQHSIQEFVGMYQGAFTFMPSKKSQDVL